jgi:flagellar motor switch protein FliM
MDGLLNQDEIDSLLAQAGTEAHTEIEGALDAMVSEAPATSAIVRFDFNRPHSISRNLEKNLRNICENFAKTSTLSLTNQFRAGVVLEFKQLRLQSFGEFFGKLPNPTCVSAMTLSPLKGPSLLHMDLGICFAMVKKLLGGASEPEVQTRELTEIELSIVRSLILKLLELFKGACARVVNLDPKLLAVENNPNYLTALAPGDNVVLLEYLLQVDSLEGRLTQCIPLTGFDPVRSQFDPDELLELRSPVDVKRDRRQVLEVVQGTTAEIVVKLGDLPLSLDQILRLDEGSILPLGKPIDAPLLVEIEQKPVFEGTAGRLHQNRAVRLIRRLSEEWTHGD